MFSKKIDILAQIEASQKRKQKHPVIRITSFLLQYSLTTVVIFLWLFAIVNFPAYATRVFAYLDEEGMQQTQQNLTNSLQNTSLSSATDNPEISQKKRERLAHIEKQETEIAFLEPEKLVQTATKIETSIDITPYENRLIIPKIGKSVPLLDVQANDQNADILHDIFMEELKNGVVRYPGTAKPGERGNAFIFGHSSNFYWEKSQYNDVFALLDYLEEGDEIIVYYNQQKYVYQVTGKKVVRPWDAKAVNVQTRKKELSLMTCWPVGTTLNRLIIDTRLVQ